MSLRRCVLGVLVLALALTTGCAGLLEFNTPAQFREKKMKEDPLEGRLVPGPVPDRVLPC